MRLALLEPAVKKLRGENKQDYEATCEIGRQICGGQFYEDIDHRLQSAARAFHVNKRIFAAKWFSIASRFKFLDAMISFRIF